MLEDESITNAIENPQWQNQTDKQYIATLDRVHDMIEEAMKNNSRKYNWFTIKGATEYCKCSKEPYIEPKNVGILKQLNQVD